MNYEYNIDIVSISFVGQANPFRRKVNSPLKLHRRTSHCSLAYIMYTEDFHIADTYVEISLHMHVFPEKAYALKGDFSKESEICFKTIKSIPFSKDCEIEVEIHFCALRRLCTGNFLKGGLKRFLISILIVLKNVS